MVDNDNLRLQVGVGALKNVVDQSTFFEVSIIERIGNNIPEAKVKLNLPYELAPYLETELAEVTINFGFSADEMIYTRWQIVGFAESNGTTELTLTTDRSYINDIAFKMYDDSSVNTMKKVVSKYFETKYRRKNGNEAETTFQVATSSDRMKWIHDGGSVRDFVDTLWLYGWCGGQTLLIPAITAGTTDPSQKAGTFRLINLGNAKNATTLSTDRTPGKGLVVVTGNLGYKGFSGKYNNIIGNVVDINFDIDKSKTAYNFTEPKKPCCDDEYQVKNIKTSTTPPNILSSNVHSNFSKAWTANLTRLARFGANSKRVQVADYDPDSKVFKNILIGDMVILNVPYAGMTASSDVHSGLYVVAETVQRIVTETNVKTYTKELVLRRDASVVTDYKDLVGTK